MGKHAAQSVEVVLLDRFNIRPHLRLVLMLASLLLVVLSAYVIRMRLSEDSVDALRLVVHTHSVKAAVHELSAAV